MTQNDTLQETDTCYWYSQVSHLNKVPPVLDCVPSVYKKKPLFNATYRVGQKNGLILKGDNFMTVGGRNLCDICQNLAISSRKKNIKLACQCIKYSLPNLLIPHVTLRCLTGRNIKHQMLAYSEPKVADSCFIETGNYEKTNVFS